MSNHASEFSKSLSPLRPSHQYSRSATDLSPPAAAKNHYFSHNHPHLHRRDKEEKLPNSSGLSLLPSALPDWSKSEGVSPNDSRVNSRRASIVASNDESTMAGGQRRTRHITPKEVADEKERSLLRVAELKKSLIELNTLSNDTTRRLDGTLYSILEKISSLQSTVLSLKELAMMARRLNNEFKLESQEVVSDIETQLDNFQEFDGPRKIIEDLQARVQTGRQKVQVLGDRVESVRQKVERWEKLEGEWQEKTRQRIKILWGIIAAVILAMVGLLIFQYTPARTVGPGVLKGFETSNLSDNISQLERILFNDTISLRRSESHGLDELRALPDEALQDDPRLRAFDDL